VFAASPSFHGVFLMRWLLLVLWVLWVLFAPKAGYLLGGIGFLAALGYLLSAATRAQIHAWMAWPLSPTRPIWPLGAAILGLLSIAWPLSHTLRQPQKRDASDVVALLKKRADQRDPTLNLAPEPSGSSTSPSSPTAAPSPSAAPPSRLAPQPRTAAPPTVRTTPRPEEISEARKKERQAIQASFKAITELQRIGREMRSLQEEIAKGNKDAMRRCLEYQRGSRDLIQEYKKQFAKTPEAIQNPLRVADGYLAGCLSCGAPMQSNTYCPQVESSHLNAVKVFEQMQQE
jgi:hypothetical protein